MKSVKVNVAKSLKIDIKVTGLLRAKIRIWCAVLLIKLAAWVMGGRGSFDLETQEMKDREKAR